MFPTDGIVGGALLYATTRVAGFVDRLFQCIYCMYVQGVGCITFLLNEVYELGEPRSGHSRARSGHPFVELRSSRLQQDVKIGTGPFDCP